MSYGYCSKEIQDRVRRRHRIWREVSDCGVCEMGDVRRRIYDLSRVGSFDVEVLVGPAREKRLIEKQTVARVFFSQLFFSKRWQL